MSALQSAPHKGGKKLRLASFFLYARLGSFYRTPVYLGSDLFVLSVSYKLTIPFADLTDVTLADEDTNSILADNAKREIQSNEAMQVV